MNKVTVGSRWWAGGDEQFVVITVIEQEGHTWVYYRNNNGNGPSKEYSCYLESFLSRFKELPT
jgi:hypothetical protein